MRLVPTAVEQEWLLSELAALLDRQGQETFLCHPIVQPSREFFPEYQGKASYLLDRVTHRLLQYAGLGNLKIEFEVFASDLDSSDEGEPDSVHGIAAFFRGIHAGVCHFGINRELPAEADFLAGVMSHEVAHAFRAQHDLVVEDPKEELLTDLTAVYLGLGLLSLNASWRTRSGSDSPFVHSWSVGWAGYLPPQALAYLLGVQMQARELGPKQVNTIMGICEPNQAEFLRASLRGPAADVEALSTRLRLEKGRMTGEAKRLEEILQPLPAFVPWEERGASYRDPASPPNAGWPVFRLQRTRADLYGLLGLLAALPLAFAEMARTEDFLAAVLLLALGAGVGIYLGRKRRRDVCSEEGCSTILSPDDEQCPACGGLIMGRIRRRSERMDAIAQLIDEGRWGDGLPDMLESDEAETPKEPL